MIIFMSQAPILGVALPVIFLAVLVEVIGGTIGLKTRYNIAVLSMASLLCLGAAALMRDGASDLPEVLYAAGVVFAVILPLYALATARRERQRGLFVGLLIVVVITVGTAVGIRVALTQQDAEGVAALIYALSFVPGVGTLLYGLFAPDIPKARGSM
jgi:hypothetical protein